MNSQGLANRLQARAPAAGPNRGFGDSRLAWAALLPFSANVLPRLGRRAPMVQTLRLPLSAIRLLPPVVNLPFPLP